MLALMHTRSSCNNKGASRACRRTKTRCNDNHGCTGRLDHSNFGGAAAQQAARLANSCEVRQVLHTDQRTWFRSKHNCL